MPFHVQLRGGVRRAWAFNLDEDQLRRDIVVPWLHGREFDLEGLCPGVPEVRWTPLDARPAWLDVPEQPVGSRFLQVYFSNENPLEVWDERYAELPSALERSGRGRALFTSPFLATIPGTDTYVDQLW